jgi:mycothiol synthase
MIRLRATPPGVDARLQASSAVHRLLAGDALDLALFGAPLLSEVVAEARSLGAATIELDVDAAGDVHAQMAAANHLRLRRELVRMARPLPVDVDPPDIALRPFRPGEDEEAWLEVNNRAFAWHPEQGGWTIDDVRQREAEPWFDPDGFLLHERGGRLAGFCWTKVHRDVRPPVGEIYVIAVDPHFAGKGLGRPLVLAGLDWLARHGLRHAILYVEGDNRPALALYENLGFEATETRRWWVRELKGAPSDGDGRASRAGTHRSDPDEPGRGESHTGVPEE